MYFKNSLPAMLVISLLWIFACKKSTDVTSDIPSGPADLSTKVTAAKVYGYVTDENDAPVAGAGVKVGTTTTTTNSYGYFEVKNAEVVKNAAVVTVTKSGYFKGIRTYIGSEGKSAFVRIKLIPKTSAGTVNAAAGGDVTLTSGLRISFPANAVMVDGSGAAYSGTVNVAAYWINPTGADLPLEMPGDLRALNTGNELRQLTTYGMVAVELTGASGETLQVATGKKATLTMPIPSSLLSSAPASIALWYFDENKGLWVEEGTATKNGNVYAGEVSHFSFWGPAVPNLYIPFECTVAFTTGEPVRYAQVIISDVNNPQNSACGFTDESGYVYGTIPANSNLVMEIQYCNSSIYNQAISTTNTSISLNNITVSSSALSVVSGTVTNCANQPATSGSIWVFAYGYYSNFPVSNTGNFSFTLPQCGNNNLTVQVVAQDSSSGQQSPALTVTLNNGNNNIGNLQACGVPNNEFVDLTLDGQRMIYTLPADTISHRVTNAPTQDRIFCGGYRVINGINVYTTRAFEYVKTGSAPGSSQQLLLIDDATDGTHSSMYGIVNPTSTFVNITEYGPVGGYIAGNFSGQASNLLTMSTSPLICQFRVKRTQ